ATLDFHNQQVNEALSLFVEITQERARAVGGMSQMEMDEVDEYGLADAQRARPTSGNLGFPLRLYQLPLQWTRTYLLNATPADIALTTATHLSADRRNLEKQIRRALFRPTNSTFKDRLVDWYQLPVKALVNADSFPVPPSPDNNSF